MYLNSLTFLRFVAAVIVVFFHFAVYKSVFPFNRPAISWLTTFLQQGNIFVAFFFVLSGFVQGYAYSVIHTINKKAYWINRLIKLYPVYLLSLLLSYACSPELLSLKSLAINVPVLTGWSWRDGWNVVNTPSWSLSAEFFFYALFPLIISWINDKPTSFLFTLSLASVLIMWAVQHPWGNTYIAGYLSPPLVNFPLFVLGVAEGIWFRRHVTRLTQWSVSNQLLIYGVGLVSIALLIAGVNWSQISAFGQLWLCSILFSGVIVSSCLLGKKSIVQQFLAAKPSQFLGEISYGIYILQVPVYTLVGKFVHVRPSLFFYVYLFVLFGLSAIVYIGVEKPFYYRFKRSMTR